MTKSIAMEKTEIDPDVLVDARGLSCPQPLLRARSVLKNLPVGAVVCVLATDAHASVDFHAYCARTSHVLLEESEDAGVYRLRVRKMK